MSGSSVALMFSGLIRSIIAGALACTIGATGALAQQFDLLNTEPDAPLRRLLSADEAKDWQAVGRLNIQGGGFCTGALIADNLVLTAAHCVYFSRTGRAVPAANIHFLAGWRKGWAAAHRQARRVIVHPDYVYDSSDQVRKVATDIALIELDTPIRSSVIKPFARYKRPRPGDQVTVVSYAKERSEVPALQEPCHMLGRQSDVLFLSCDVNHGSSGAPIFIRQDGAAKIVSVVSAMAEWNDRDVALGTSLGAPLEQLIAHFEENDPTFQSVSPGARGLALPQVGQSDGPLRKVVRPPSN